MGLTINIYAGATPVPITSIKPAIKSTPKPETTVPTKVDKDVAFGDGLDVELMNRDNMEDDEKIDLEQRVVLYVRGLLAKNDRELKQGISDEITNVKKDL